MPLSAEQFIHSFDYDEIFLVSCTEQTRPRQTTSVWASFTHRVQLSVKLLNTFNALNNGKSGCVCHNALYRYMLDTESLLR